MTVKLNDAAFKHAKKLIKDGKYKTGSDWSEDQPSPEDESAFLDDHSWDEYAKWYLAIDTEEDQDNKGHYEFPYGDFKEVYRSGVIAAKQRAAQYDHKDVENAADELLEMIDQKEK